MIRKSYAKINIFLKIVGIKDDYHLLASRFVKVKNLYDTISFEKKSLPNDEFILEGRFGCETKRNTIYKIYKELKKFWEVEEFFKTYKVVVEKNIPEFAGLGGGSSNCATFLNMCNEICSLNLSLEKKIEIGKSIGSDVAFFIYGYDSANVFGVGEIVKEFKEEALDIKTFTPPIECSTPLVYKEFRKNFLNFDRGLANKLLKLNSKEILRKYKKEQLNDLFLPALKLYPKLKEYIKENYFFSGSGSTLFWY
jgi:4-diphosphocytidyl-2-C-methyl-D-erythritol kinase